MELNVSVEAEAVSDLIGLAKPLVKTADTLVKALLGEPCKVAGSLLADKVYAWQVQNRIRALVRTSELLKDKGIDPRSLPPGFLIPLLEAAGHTDDPDLQELWARLLAGAVTDSKAQHPLFIDALRRMSGADAKLFARLWPHKSAEYKWPETSIKPYLSNKFVSVGPPPLLLELNDLETMAVLVVLGLVETSNLGLGTFVSTTLSETFQVSRFGYHFAGAIGLE